MGRKEDMIGCEFDSISLHLRLQSKVLEPAVAKIEKKILYLGNFNFSVKPKDIAKLEINNDTQSLRIHIAKGDRIYDLDRALDVNAFVTFADRLKYCYDKKNPQVESFIERSSAKALGARKKPPSRPRVAFGRNARALGAPVTPNKHTSSAFAKTIFPEASTSQVPSKSLRKSKMEMDLAFSDDEEPTEQPEAHASAEGPVDEPPAEREDGDWSEHSSDNDVDLPENNTKSLRKKVTGKRRPRIQSKLCSGEVSDDDDIFAEHTMTTPPRPERRVTPGTRTATKVEKGTLASFFQAKTAVPIQTEDNHPTETPRPSRDSNTPTSYGTPSPSPSRYSGLTRYAATPRTAQIVKRSVKKNELQRSDAWLHTSPTRISSAEKAHMALFRTRSPFSSLQNDDIQSSPAKPIPSSSKRLELRRTYDVLGPQIEQDLTQADGAKDMKRLRTGSLERNRMPTSAEEKHEQGDKEKTAFKFRGLYNLGNTCYMAASLQMLFSATKWIEQLRNRGGPLTQQFVLLADQVADKSDYRAVNPKALKQAIDKITDKFSGYLQRDAHEFISDLVDNIHEELVKEVKALKVYDKQGTEEDSDRTRLVLTHNKDMNASTATVGQPHEGLTTTCVTHETPTTTDARVLETTDILSASDVSNEILLPTDDFRLTVEVSLKCNSCGYSRSKVEIYRHLSIDVCFVESAGTSETIKASVAAGLSKFFQPEVREIKCEHCSDGSHASQTLRIVSRPQLLMIHLKRFIWLENKIAAPTINDENAEPNTNVPRVEYVLKKNKDPVELSEILDLSPFRSEDMVNIQANCHYSLRSVIYHHGLRAESGHYSADALRVLPEGTPLLDGNPAIGTVPVWVGFDDTFTALTSLDRIVASKQKQERAYLILYGLDE